MCVCCLLGAMPGSILSRLMSPLYVPHSLSAVCASSCHIARLACPMPPPMAAHGCHLCLIARALMPHCAARTNYISISVFHLPLATCRKGAAGGPLRSALCKCLSRSHRSKSARKMCSGAEITFINTYKASRDSTLTATSSAWNLPGFVCRN